MSSIFGAASIPFIGCITLLASMVLQILSYAAPFWASDNNGNFGLWRKYRCISGTDGSFNEDLGCYKQDHPWYIGDWLDAVRAMESLAIIFWAIPLVIIPVYMYVADGLYYRCTLGTMTSLTLLGAICNLIGFLVYSSKIANNSNWSTGWCFIICVIADAIGFLSFAIFLVSTCKRPKFVLDEDRHYISEFYNIPPGRNDLFAIDTGVPFKDGSILNGNHTNPILTND